MDLYPTPGTYEPRGFAVPGREVPLPVNYKKIMLIIVYVCMYVCMYVFISSKRYFLYAFCLKKFFFMDLYPTPATYEPRGFAVPGREVPLPVNYKK